MLRNLLVVFERYPTIPVEIFLEPFVKQVMISENKSYEVNIFDFEFITSAVRHRKLRVNVGLELYDLLAKIKLNSPTFSKFASDSMEILMDRFIDEESFAEYVQISINIDHQAH